MKTRVKIRASMAIQDVSYDDNTETLTVHMLDNNKGQGRRLQYSPVPRRVFDELLKAESKGGYYNANIRNQYPFLGG